MNLKRWLVILLVPALFFIFAVGTIKDYGINWDEPIHFNRGQSYLYFLLTSKEEIEPLSTKPSFFHGYPPRALWTWDGGHPPASDIMAAFINFIFYQKLGILGDIASYHLFNILTATLLIVVVAFFAYKTYGIFASLITSIALASYPLFFSESHFNIKDPPEAAFIGITIFAFWLSLSKVNWRWLLVSTVFAGLALGTKFNAAFLPFIITPYVLIRYYPIVKRGPKYILSQLEKTPPAYLKMLILAPVISFIIFFVLWPFLWQNPLGNFLKVLHYYKNIGTGFNYQTGKYLIGGFNLYPVFWILITTPPLVLFLAIIGIIFAIVKPDGKKTTFLWLLWLGVPVIRVSLPNTSIYGGVRQIMEFIPAMALLAGVGGYYLREWLTYLLKKARIANAKKIGTVVVLASFLPHLFVMAKLHPNENVYFNKFIGGLPGAKAREIPSWGNSYGNAYWQAIKWLNDNAEPNSRLALVQGTGQNVAAIQLRSDINFSNTNWSGVNRNGEYLMELIYDKSVRAYPYAWEYIEKMLEPVYDVKVEGVTIARVWKNDLEHTKREWRKKETLYQKSVTRSVKNGEIIIQLKEDVLLSRLIFYLSDTCAKTSATVQTAIDGSTWFTEPDSLPTEQISKTYNFSKDSTDFYLPGRKARFIKILFLKDGFCFSDETKINLVVFE